MDVLDDRQSIKPGDRISVRILEERRDAIDYDVPQDGMIPVPRVGQVKATGLTCMTLARLIQQKLSVLPPGKLTYLRSGLPAVVVTLNSHVTSCSPDPVPSPQQALDAFRLQPGRVVSIRIVEDKREALEQVIPPSGKINAPYIGLVKAAGLTTQELATKVKAGLERNFFLTATVVVRVGAFKPPLTSGCFIESHLVIGHIMRPGKYDFPSDDGQTVSAALTRAGGHTSPSAVPVIKIFRKTPQGNKTILVDAHAVLVKKSKEHDLFLRPDDVMMVD